ncbi:hypothetical protein [Clostridium luticellarii]|uniref:Uncharacterized protein n=1 Tax=Clostridium luticellarii TaxID=1691940 RepID=A0A2T0BNJ7_9CLOT|nr:hypothetical protein [Clostridium luticellarii]MCI1944374.1 hypothetical protein [Clostridium luticellarii]MCI1967494.1 hypothetical protein [Clostridium luticellarii]MCI1995006.1 hypothetical protein [Clostridium luticellarii]MCI2039555.1 hypothetical protein [Clostridium luticellarii]PRR85454.1 hypothetical protein CLLU_15240 [Clostridium luticellarii]
MNFYTVLDEEPGELKKFHSKVKSDNPIYLNLQAGDIIISEQDNLEYVVVKIIKNLYKKELDVYITGVKSKEEIMDEIENLANKTIKSVLESIKDTLDLDDKKDFSKD